MSIAEEQPQAPASMSWTSVAARPRVWGLGAEALLDAWWRSQGVQWIQRGSKVPVESGGDLYLLTEPAQAVMFDLGPLVSSLTWNRPAITRLRVVSSQGDEYRERIVLGDHGGVVGIRREYWRESTGRQRVLLTASASIARRWSESRGRRDTWIELRRSGVWARSDHHRVAGERFQIGDASQEGLLLTAIIERWADPDRVIEGIESFAPGVWVAKGQAMRPDDVLVGPAWVGHRPADEAPLRVVGPAWSSDRGATVSPPAKVAAIGEVREASASHNRAPRPQPEHGYDALKRSIDVVASALGLVALSPLLLLVAIAVALDDGWPLVFGHERQTRGGRTFRCLKFRTMRRNAEALVKDFQDRNVCDGPQVYIENDPRVTRVGRVLRKYHLDELLQLVNVLSGDMSLVGPRPSPERENRLCPAWRDARLSVRPGITGLWQVCRTRQPGLDFQEWIRFDMQYVETRSLSLDCWIVYRTLRGVIKKESPHGVVEANAT